MIIFDIETGPLPEADLIALQPEFEPPKNLRDPAKIDAALQAAKTKWLENAALSSISGRVLCIGVLDTEADKDGDELTILQGDEPSILTAWWDYVRALMVGTSQRMAGWNIYGFDLPFLVQRSWINRVAVPTYVREGRYWSRTFVDLMELWCCHPHERCKLDYAARALGVGAKTGAGKDFAALWHGGEDSRARAIEYLHNDLRLTAKVAEIIYDPLSS